MSEYRHLSGYRIVWIWALFDLPVVTKPERKSANGFRKSLLNLGFEMVQFSVYSKYSPSKEKAEVIATKVGDLVPENGKVDILFFTDKQYSRIQSYRGIPEDLLPEKPAQFVLF